MTEQRDAGAAQHVVIREPRRVARASDFSLTTGRIAYKDDEQGTGTSLTYSRDLDASGPAGSRLLVVPHGDPVGLSASGSDTAVAQQFSPKLSGFRCLFLDDYLNDACREAGISDPVLQLSGNRVLYFAPAGAGLVQPTVQQVNMDTVTPTTTVGPVQRAKHGSHWLQPAAIWGDSVYYATPHGGIARRDLADDTTSTVLAPDASLPARPAMEIFAYGDEVGWDIGTSRAAYRDVTSSAAPISVASGANTGRVITGLSVDGVTVNAQGLLPYRNLSGISTVFRLVPYGATGGRAILSGSHLDRGPQLNDGVQAWLDDSGVVREAALPGALVVSAPPRYLGSVFVANGLAPEIIIPYSQPLTSCSIDLRQGGTLVGTVRCQGTGRYGEAVYNPYLDPPGLDPSQAITYSVHAAGAGGAAELADGSAGDVTGTVDFS